MASENWARIRARSGKAVKPGGTFLLVFGGIYCPSTGMGIPWAIGRIKKFRTIIYSSYSILVDSTIKNGV